MENPKPAIQEDDPRDFAEMNFKRSSVFGDTTRTALDQITGTPVVIELKQLKSSDIIFAFIGPTGSGKSTFIKALTGYDCKVGHGIESCTKDIQVIRMIPDSPMDPSICFIDTPGFDDAERSDYSTFETLSNTLISIFKQGLLLSGLLYFHRISDVRMGGTPLTNIRFFHQLCSTELSRLVYVTTMWDMEDAEVAEKRESDLVATYWRPLVKTGCTTKRYLNTKESGVKILWPLVEKELERRGGLDVVVKTKSRYIAHGGEILASLLVDRWQQLMNAGRLRRQIRKMSSHGFVKEVSKEDIVVMLVGPSGAGKTHLINLLSSKPEILEHQLTGSTRKVQIHRVHGHVVYGDKLVLVDTPAIGAVNASDAIGKWISKLYKSGGRLSAILSLYGISDGLVYQSSVAIRILHVYLGLAVPDYRPEMMAFVTTGWDKMDLGEQEATQWARREKGYVGTVCDGIIEEGRTPTHFNNTLESASTIVREVLNRDHTSSS